MHHHESYCRIEYYMNKRSSRELSFAGSVSAVTASVATVICHHQQKVRMSTLIYTRAVFMCSLGVSGMLSV